MPSEDLLSDILQSEKLLSVGQVLLFEDADLKSTIALEELVRC